MNENWLEFKRLLSWLNEVINFDIKLKINIREDHLKEFFWKIVLKKTSNVRINK